VLQRKDQIALRCFRRKTKFVRKKKVLILFGMDANIKREKDRAVNEMRSERKTPLFYRKTDRTF
jgi:hypothetical protein